ncbi:hypothetical protein [Duganella sp. Root336D2]|uniref:hypothetical protein n=1 Tax=Duganella sp. Root336D2 TaxID=1736518 RepID=UPI0006F43E2D|nr:hypothetical protein [Duganella sp. Root336D2]KQV59452.1 hypothetical protein ASD07_24880 [Duganella sp. Root336D2]
MDKLFYLTPSLCLALASWVLSRRYVVFTLLRLPGTLCHELAHFLAGLATFARPTSLSIIPRRAGRGYRLGEVQLANARWYNSAPTALAPILLLLIPWWVATLRARGAWHFTPLDAGLAFLVAPQFLACWPSATDWKLAMRSWPLAFIAGAGWYAWAKYPWLHSWP